MPVFSLGEIREAWAEYKEAKVFSQLVNGEWKDEPMVDGFVSPARLTATRAKIGLLRDTMGFPKFLEEIWKRR